MRSRMMPVFKTSLPVGPVCANSGWKILVPLPIRIPSPMEGSVCCWILMPMIIVSSIAARTIIVMTLNILRLRFSIFMIKFSVAVLTSRCQLLPAKYGSSTHHRSKTLEPHPSSRESLPPPLGGHGNNNVLRGNSLKMRSSPQALTLSTACLRRLWQVLFTQPTNKNLLLRQEIIGLPYIYERPIILCYKPLQRYTKF